MKKDLLIIGAGNVGGFIAYNFAPLAEKYNLLGFLDDDVNKIGRQIYDLPVLGDIDSLLSYKEIAIVVGIGFPEIKRLILNRINHKLDLEIVSYIADNVWISEKVYIGKGVVIYPGVSINYETKIEDFVTINMNCAIGHNVVLSGYVTLAPNVSLAGFTSLGECVEMGIGSSTKQQVQISELAVIGGNAMVINNIPSKAVAVGCPAKIVKYKI